MVLWTCDSFSSESGRFGGPPLSGVRPQVYSLGQVVPTLVNVDMYSGVSLCQYGCVTPGAVFESFELSSVRMD